MGSKSTFSLEEGGMLYGKQVYVFVNAVPKLVTYKGVNMVVVIESRFPPSDKIALILTERAEEEIIPMKEMGLDWLPYKHKLIGFLSWHVRRVAPRKSVLGTSTIGFLISYYYDPFKQDGLEQSTEVQIMFPSEPPVVCFFDWSFHGLEEFVDNFIKEEYLHAEQKDEFKEFVKEHVEATKKARLEATAARLKTIEELSLEARQAFQSAKFYKFYPRPSPDISRLLTGPIINRYYGDAHLVL